MRLAAVLATLISLPNGAAPAQALPPALATLEDGVVSLSFPLRARACWSQNVQVFGDRCPCGTSVAFATMRLAGGRVAGFGMRVPGTPGAVPADSAGVRLGRLSGSHAAALLLALAARGGADGEDLVAAASIADSATVWPELLDLARNRGLASDTRRAAIFWLGQAAGAAAGGGLDSIATDAGTDRGLREHAVFALSQRPAEEAVPALIRIARTNGDGAIRRKAVFWLGQTEDPRAVALFEEILQR
jgi:hypothetical protein